jgi:hypothetical protein
MSKKLVAYFSAGGVTRKAALSELELALSALAELNGRSVAADTLERVFFALLRRKIAAARHGEQAKAAAVAAARCETDLFFGFFLADHRADDRAAGPAIMPPTTAPLTILLVASGCAEFVSAAMLSPNMILCISSLCLLNAVSSSSFAARSSGGSVAL